MILDDKLVAEHRRVFIRLFSDPHVERASSDSVHAPQTHFYLPFQMVRDSPGFLPCFLHAQGQTAIEWRVTLLLVGGGPTHGAASAAAPEPEAGDAQRREQLQLSIAT